jgi:hypothetical protein
MEGSIAMIVAISILAGGCATGAAILVDGDLMGAEDTDGVQQVEALPYGGVDGSCSLHRAEGDCAAGDEGCSTDGTAKGSGGCCG